MTTDSTGTTGSVSENTQQVDRTLKPLHMKNSNVETFEDKRLSDNDLLDLIMCFIGDNLHCLH